MALCKATHNTRCLAIFIIQAPRENVNKDFARYRYKFLWLYKVGFYYRVICALVFCRKMTYNICKFICAHARKEVSMGKFVVKPTKSGYRFNLVAGNGEIIATSENYSSKDACLGGVESVRNNAPVANLEDQSVDGYSAEKHPKFELYVDKAGEFRFRLKAKNGEIIAASEGYKAKSSCKSGIESVRKNAVDATVAVEEAK